MQVPFFELRAYLPAQERNVTSAIEQVLAQKRFVLGPEVQTCEESFAKYLSVRHVVGVGNGYDALVMCLAALNVGNGDEVLLPANTFIATINAVVRLGATPVLLEPDILTYNITPSAIKKHSSAKVKAVIPVHLFGQPCLMPPLMEVAQAENIFVVEDCAQAHGATVYGQKVGSFGQVNAFSFYPTKNLGALGDAGAAVTQDVGIAQFLRQFGNYGQSERYMYEIAGLNSRLDTLQAAVLQAKLPFLDEFNAERKRLAAIYDNELSGLGDLILPFVSPGVEHVYHLYVVRTSRRNALQQYLQRKGIQTLIHYPVPPHLQPAYRHLGYRKGDFPVTEELADTSLSLPLFPGMTEAEQQCVITHLKGFFTSPV